jgi:hypothetical protein
MQTILAQPFGKFLLTAAALGFVAFGVFAILQSRYAGCDPAAPGARTALGSARRRWSDVDSPHTESTI